MLGHGCGSWDLHCGVSLSSSGVSLSSCGVRLSSCGVDLSSCGVSLSSCGVSLSSCGVRLSSCVQALESVGSVVMVHRLSCPAACGILVPWSGMEPTFFSLEGKFLTTGPQGSPFFPLSFRNRHKEVWKVWEDINEYSSRTYLRRWD